MNMSFYMAYLAAGLGFSLLPLKLNLEDMVETKEGRRTGSRTRLYREAFLIQNGDGRWEHRLGSLQ